MFTNTVAPVKFIVVVFQIVQALRKDVTGGRLGVSRLERGDLRTEVYHRYKVGKGCFKYPRCLRITRIHKHISSRVCL